MHDIIILIYIAHTIHKIHFLQYDTLCYAAQRYSIQKYKTTQQHTLRNQTQDTVAEGNTVTNKTTDGSIYSNK